MESITNGAELQALDRTLVVISVDPGIGEPISGGTAGPQLRQYAGEVEQDSGREADERGSNRVLRQLSVLDIVLLGRSACRPAVCSRGDRGPAGAALSPSPHCAAFGGAAKRYPSLRAPTRRRAP
ncbi:hypothetical protein [Streptomyces sp. NPDC091215]|uniref:hypothetical protein n=1 Tax=Streptomyces sp. NPDC091215 TaxID=3155192 RepID=UPI0034436AF8